MKARILCAFLVTAALFGACTKQGQLLEIYDVDGSSATARLTIDGKEIFKTQVYIGKNGIGKTREGDGKTPTGTLHVKSAFGVLPNPGTTLPYINITPSTFACDEDCEYYNHIIDTAQTHHQCMGEDMYNLVPYYNYGITTDYNEECDHQKGSNIFLHCKGPKDNTGGCIAFDEERMIEILTNCDASLVVTIRE